MAAGLREMTHMGLYVGNKNIENNILNISPKNKATSAISITYSVPHGISPGQNTVKRIPPRSQDCII